MQAQNKRIFATTPPKPREHPARRRAALQARFDSPGGCGPYPKTVPRHASAIAVDNGLLTFANRMAGDSKRTDENTREA